jgi:hypothetical protein
MVLLGRPWKSFLLLSAVGRSGKGEKMRIFDWMRLEVGFLRRAAASMLRVRIGAVICATGATTLRN